MSGCVRNAYPEGIYRSAHVRQGYLIGVARRLRQGSTNAVERQVLAKAHHVTVKTSGATTTLHHEVITLEA